METGRVPVVGDNGTWRVRNFDGRVHQNSGIFILFFSAISGIGDAVGGTLAPQDDAGA